METITIHEAVKGLGANETDDKATRARDLIMASLTMGAIGDFIQELGPDTVVEGRDHLTEMDLALMNDKLCSHLTACFKLAVDFDLPVADHLTTLYDRKVRRDKKKSHVR